MVNNNGTKNGGYGSMDSDANAGIGLLAAILMGAGTIAAKKSYDSKQSAELERKLNEVRYELSKKKGNIFREAWYASEIEELEEQERKLLAEIKKLK